MNPEQKKKFEGTVTDTLHDVYNQAVDHCIEVLRDERTFYMFPVVPAIDRVIKKLQSLKSNDNPQPKK